MKYVFAIWAAPLVLFWGWFFLSLNDMSFGFAFMSRQVHDLVFQIYGHILGIDPGTIPSMIAKACILDTCILLAIWAFRRRHAILAWVRARRARAGGVEAMHS